MKVYLCQKGFRFITDLLRELLPDDEILECLPEEITTKARDANVLIPTIIPLNEAELSLPGLKLVQQFGAGLDVVDIASASSNGVFVANVPAAGTGNAESVAEVAVMHMLKNMRLLVRLARAVALRVSMPMVARALRMACAATMRCVCVRDTVRACVRLCVMPCVAGCCVMVCIWWCA